LDIDLFSAAPDKASFEGYQQPIADALGRMDQRPKEAERERVHRF
jgi:hypothetical protein